MKVIPKIASTELRILFFSPIAWFLLVVFLVQCGIVYVNLLESITRTQEMGGLGLQYLSEITERIYLSPDGFFTNVMQNLYLYIPLLTMSLVSRETSSGTIKLLYSSPVKVRYMVLGKYLAMMVYSLLMVAIVGVFVVSGIIQIKEAETGMLMSALLGFYLLLLTYSAIGLFMSSLTTYQVVAAISSFVMIGILSYIGKLWQDIAFVRDLTYFLSINGRAFKLLSGLITTKDIIYFVLVTGLFLSFTVLKIKAGMESKPWTVKVARYAAVFVITLMAGYLSSLPSLVGYYDTTSNKSRTLTPNARRILAQLGEEPLEVTTYNNVLGKFWYLGNPKTFNENMERWEPYLRFKPTIRFQSVYYYDSTLDVPRLMKGYPGKTIDEVAVQNVKARDLDLKRFKTPAEMHKLIDLRPELNRFVMQLKWKDRTTFLRVFDDRMVWPDEAEVAAAFKRLQQAKLPRVGFLTGNLERSISKAGDRDYKAVTTLKTFRYALINQGFDVDTISLDAQDIPKDIATLVVADPKLTLSDAAINRLKQYIDAGGNLLITCEPGKQAQTSPLLQHLGVQMMEGQIVQQSQDFAPNMVTTDITPYAATFSGDLSRSQLDSMKISMPGVAGLRYQATGGFEMHPLLVTDAKLAWNKKGKLDADLATEAEASARSSRANATPVSMMEEEPVKKPDAGTLHFSAGEGDERGPFITALSLNRKVNGKEQRIVVTGDADFMGSAELARFNMRTANFYLNIALFKWLSNGEFPIDTSRPDAKDKRVSVSLDEVKFLRTLYVWILPAILLAFAAILLIRRKRK